MSRTSKILLITDAPREDSRQLSELLRVELRAEVVLVEYAHTEEDALVFYTSDQGDSLEAGDVAAVLIDIQKGEDEALAIVRRIATSESYGEVPVIVAQSADVPATVRRAFEAGAADFVSHGPTLSVELAARIAHAIERKGEVARLTRNANHLERMTEDLKTANIIFRSISIHDELTGVPNRRFFDRYLDIMWRQSLRGGTPISLVMIDVDHFKKYNDTYGHQAGDRCLQAVARALETALSEKNCILARYGGEEFAGILPEMDLEPAAVYVEAMRLAVWDLAITHEASTHGRVSISAGIATAVPGLTQRPSQLVHKADRALYQAKESGRNCVVK